MLIEKTRLNENALLTAYIADDTGYKRDGLLIIPGGGYNNVCKETEGEPVALAFLGKGVNTFVLEEYSVAENALFPNSLIDASLAMKHIKDNADKYNIEKERVFACGFSAGGHLCASLGVLWKLDAIYEKIDMERGYNKPKGIIPCYPVVSGITDTHLGSIKNLCGKEDTVFLYGSGAETFVDEESAPAFIFHTANDHLVPVVNSLVLAAAYSKAKVPFALHIFPDAPHGVALGNEITRRDKEEYVKPDIAQWVDMAHYWMKGIK